MTSGIFQEGTIILKSAVQFLYSEKMTYLDHRTETKEMKAKNERYKEEYGNDNRFTARKEVRLLYMQYFYKYAQSAGVQGCTERLQTIFHLPVLLLLQLP